MDTSQTNKTNISILKRLVVWRSFLWEYLNRKVLPSNLSNWTWIDNNIFQMIYGMPTVYIQNTVRQTCH